jgi:hypothetical protein
LSYSFVVVPLDQGAWYYRKLVERAASFHQVSKHIAHAIPVRGDECREMVSTKHSKQLLFWLDRSRTFEDSNFESHGAVCMDDHESTAFQDALSEEEERVIVVVMVNPKGVVRMDRDGHGC